MGKKSIERKNFLKLVAGTILGGIGASGIFSIFKRADRGDSAVNAAETNLKPAADSNEISSVRLRKDARTVTHREV